MRCKHNMFKLQTYFRSQIYYDWKSHILCLGCEYTILRLQTHNVKVANIVSVTTLVWLRVKHTIFLLQTYYVWVANTRCWDSKWTFWMATLTIFWIINIRCLNLKHIMFVYEYLKFNEGLLNSTLIYIGSDAY